MSFHRIHVTTLEDAGMSRYVRTSDGSLAPMDEEAKYRVEGWPAVAVWLLGAETEPDEDTEWTGLEEPTGRVVVVMVGDDVRHAVDPEDLVMLEEDESCPGCGQIGCGAYR